MPTLDLATRSRVTARDYVTKGLSAMPERVAVAVRERHLAKPTPLTRRVTGLLRHRTIGHLDTFTVGDLEFAAVDSVVSRRLYWQGLDGYEPGESATWRELCQRATRIVEIGANIGYYTVLGARAASDTPYVSVEAHPFTASVLARNVELNGLTNVEIVNAAAVADPSVESLELALPDQEHYVAPTGAFLTSGAEGVGEYRAAQRTITVPATSAAALVEGCDLLKLDIEGAEHLVLEAALPGLLQRRATLFVEVLRSTPQLREQLVTMLDAGYRAEVLAPAGLLPISAEQLRQVDLLPAFGSRDVLMSPGERAPTP